MKSKIRVIEVRESILPTQLAKLAGNRDNITTDEFALVVSVSQQTLRKNYCLTGHAYGIKPIKVGNRLLWSVDEIATLIGGQKNAK